MTPKRTRRRTARIDTSRIRMQLCPTCGEVIDAATGVELDGGGPVRPTPGAFVICFECAAVGVFDAECQIRALTDAEAAGLPPFVRLMRRWIRMGLSPAEHTHCLWCGAVLMGGATKHGPDCWLRDPLAAALADRKPQ